MRLLLMSGRRRLRWYVLFLLWGAEADFSSCFVFAVRALLEDDCGEDFDKLGVSTKFF